MKKLLLILPFIVGCAQLDKSVNELSEDKKQGCYHKDVMANGNGIYTNGTYGKNAVFCTDELPEHYCYEMDNGRTKVKVGNCK